MRVVFMGTPDFAKVALQGLINDAHKILAVFTQPDKPRGRSKKLVASEVKQLAIENNIEVIQPIRLRRDINAIERLRQLNPDVIVVAAYGQILPKEVIEIPKYGCINIHASLLPRYRGAAPINWCLINGESKTGVTIMQMDEGLDTGDIIAQEEIIIDEEMDSEELTEELASVGAYLLEKTLKNIKNIKRIKQDDSLSNYAPLLTKDLSKIDFTKNAKDIHNLIRAIVTWPTAESTIRGKRIKIFKSFYAKSTKEAKFGEIIEKQKHQISVKCGQDTILIIKEVQLEGKKKMSISSFLQGFNLEVGECFE